MRYIGVPVMRVIIIIGIRWDLVIWLVHLIYSAVGFALCYNYVILNYCIRFSLAMCQAMPEFLF